MGTRTQKKKLAFEVIPNWCGYSRRELEGLQIFSVEANAMGVDLRGSRDEKFPIQIATASAVPVGATLICALRNASCRHNSTQKSAGPFIDRSSEIWTSGGT
jgi:hypothetical protein